MRITCLVNDNYQGTPNPLIYVVDVADPANHADVLQAVTKERLADLGWGSDESDLDLTLLLAFKGETETVGDWRDF